MSKKFRRFYETAFDSKISKSDEDLLSAEKQDAAIARRLTNQLQLSASASSVQQCAGVARASPSKLPSCKNRLFGFLLQQHKRRGRRRSDCNNEYRSSDSVATSSSLSLESITSDSLSSHSSESPCYRRFPEPHVLSPISDKSSQDAAGCTAAEAAGFLQDCERRGSSSAAFASTGASASTAAAAAAAAAGVASAVKTKPPQSLGLIKLNRDHHQHHGSDSGISVGSKPGDNYQELLDVPFDMPKLRRRQRAQVFHGAAEKPQALSLDATDEDVPRLPFDMPKLRRKQTDLDAAAAAAAALPFDMPKLRKRQMDSCARVVSLDFEIGDGDVSSGGNGAEDDRSAAETGGRQLEQLPFDIPKLKRIDLQTEGERKPDRSSLFLDVRPNNNTNSASVDTNNKPLPKIFQNKNQPNRPTLSLSNIKPLHFVEDIDVSLPLDQQCWYHGSMNRFEAEKALHGQGEGSYLVRGNKGSYALSIKSAKGFIHMRITQSGDRNYLGQSDRPFETIPDLIRHYTLNKLPAKGAEHVGLIRPLAQQIL